MNPTATVEISNTGTTPIRVMTRPGEFFEIEPGNARAAVISGDLVVSPMAARAAEESTEESNAAD